MSVVLSDAWLQRFGGTARLYGQAALQLFAEAHVCVIGIGGVGSWAAEALARTGIG
ncbi:tRNA cyclic N6-threonylcarbamoyladenosine(37) synthase TcdA, partial [Staphylococcus aureus]|nr:tRNA cyclic N6-threonylcarbamoyladenosine(37) synthase TcdA [Staphylococcus aureus]